MEIIELVKGSKNPRLLYWFEEEPYYYSLEKWQEIKTLLEENKTAELLSFYCSTENYNRREVYVLVKTSQDRQLLYWWNNEKNFHRADEEFESILELIGSGEFQEYLDLNYSEEYAPEPKLGDFISETSEEEKQEEEDGEFEESDSEVKTNPESSDNS